MKKFLEMHQFSNVPNKAADFYKEKDEETAAAQKKEAPKPKSEKPKEGKDNGKGSKKN